MTAREVYEAVLVEINKEKAPTFTVEEFNYVLNKAILAFVNEKHNFYAANQQLSDDLRVLLRNAKFTIDLSNPVPTPVPVTYNPIRGYTFNTVSVGATTIPVSLLADLEVGSVIAFDPEGAISYTITDVDDAGYPYTITLDSAVPALAAGISIYKEAKAITKDEALETGSKDRVLTCSLPASDYLHMLSCRMYWAGSKIPGSTAPEDQTQLVFPAKRLTYDMLNAIENNTYLRPAANRPYFKVHDNQMNSGITRLAGDLKAYRAYQNKPRIDLHIGRERVSIKPVKVSFDYLKLPELVVLEDIDIFTAGPDTSQSLELPDYLKNEIVRRITAYLLEKTGDPRISTQPHFNQEIPSVPPNMQQPQQATQRGPQNQ